MGNRPLPTFLAIFLMAFAASPSAPSTKSFTGMSIEVRSFSASMQRSSDALLPSASAAASRHFFNTSVTSAALAGGAIFYCVYVLLEKGWGWITVVSASQSVDGWRRQAFCLMTVR